jgi:hypothetical protein
MQYPETSMLKPMGGVLTSEALDGFCQDVLYSGIQPIRGDKLLESSVQPERMSTGFKELDGMLLGGLLRGSVTEFAGPANTCKTVVHLLLWISIDIVGLEHLNI